MIAGPVTVFEHMLSSFKGKVTSGERECPLSLVCSDTLTDPAGKAQLGQERFKCSVSSTDGSVVHVVAGHFELIGTSEGDTISGSVQKKGADVGNFVLTALDDDDNEDADEGASALRPGAHAGHIVAHKIVL